MRATKSKMLRRLWRAERANGRSASIKELKQKFCKGQPLGLVIYYTDRRIGA